MRLKNNIMLAALLGCMTIPLAASEGITADSVTFAQVAAMEGPAGRMV